MNVNTIKAGISEAKEKLDAARDKKASGEYDLAFQRLSSARDCIADAAKEFELADVPKVQEILDIEKWVEVTE
jgi:hypothetical protein